MKIIWNLDEKNLKKFNFGKSTFFKTYCYFLTFNKETSLDQNF